MSHDMYDGIVEVMEPDDYNRHGNDDMFNVYDDFDQKGNKNKNKKKTPVEVKHEGYTLEKAQPRSGEKPSWARIGQRPLPFDDKTLVDIVKRHRKAKGTVVEQDFKELTANQQGVVNRLLEERKRKEKTKNADWILYDVQRFGKWKWRTVDVKQIQVILKRVDKTMQLKNGEYVKNQFKNQYHDFEIIDLAEPTTTTGKKKDKKPKKSRSLDDLFDPVDDALGLGLGGIPPPRDHGRQNSNVHPHFDQHMPRDSRSQFDQFPPQPPPFPPPGAFPQDQNGPGQFGQPPFPPQQFQPQPYPASARQSFSTQNPFQPDPNVAPPAQFELPPMNMNDPPWPHPHQKGLERARTRSHSRDRRHSRPSIGVDTKMLRLEDKIDNLTTQMEHWKMSSESSEFGDESLISPSDGNSWTPPSSPRSYFSENRARGSLERRRSSASRDPRYHPKYRSHRYRDAEIEPAYSYRSDRRTYSPEYHRRGSKRPSLHHSQTYAADDYPIGSAAEPRYLPPAPNPPRPIQRRLTEYSDRDRFENRGFDDRRQSDFRDMQDSRRFGDQYDGGRRESTYDGGRRRSYVGGSGGGGSGGGGGYYQ